MLRSPYPWHYTLRWPLYCAFPSTRNHTRLIRSPDQYRFGCSSLQTTRLLFCGDIMVHNGDLIPTLHPKLCQLINASDYMIGNCEAPLSERNLDANVKFKFNFDMPRKYLEEIISQTDLPASNWLLSIANNHSGDQGYENYLHSHTILKEMDVQPLGHYLPDQLPLEIISINGMRLGIVAWAKWMNCDIFSDNQPGPLRDHHLRKFDWKKIKKDCKLDYLIGLPHWEYEFQHFPSKKTQQVAKHLIDEGHFDLLVGIHTHTLQSLEFFDRGLCFYNLGNFYGFGYSWPTNLIPLLEIKLHPSLETCLVSYQLHYFYQHIEKGEASIIPIEEAPPNIKSRLMKRINKMYYTPSGK